MVGFELMAHGQGVRTSHFEDKRDVPASRIVAALYQWRGSRSAAMTVRLANMERGPAKTARRAASLALTSSEINRADERATRQGLPTPSKRPSCTRGSRWRPRQDAKSIPAVGWLGGRPADPDACPRERVFGAVAMSRRL